MELELAGLENAFAGGFHDGGGKQRAGKHGEAGEPNGGAVRHDARPENAVDEVGGVVLADLETIPGEHAHGDGHQQGSELRHMRSFPDHRGWFARAR